MTNDKKDQAPREWTLEADEGGICVTKGSMFLHDTIPVIEKSAYDNLAQRLEKAEALLWECIDTQMDMGLYNRINDYFKEMK